MLWSKLKVYEHRQLVKVSTLVVFMTDFLALETQKSEEQINAEPAGSEQERLADEGEIEEQQNAEEDLEQADDLVESESIDEVADEPESFDDNELDDNPFDEEKSEEVLTLVEIFHFSKTEL